MARDHRIIDLDGPSEPTQQPEGTYVVYVGCQNCDYEDETEIPKGVKIDAAECPECGCAELVKCKPITPAEDVQPEQGEGNSSEIRDLLDQLRRQPPVVEPGIYPPYQTIPPNPQPRPMIPNQPHRSPNPFDRGYDRHEVWMGVTPPNHGADSFNISSGAIAGDAAGAAEMGLMSTPSTPPAQNRAAGHQMGLLAACGVNTQR